MFWAAGFWAPGFWAPGFWQEATVAVVDRLLPPISELLLADANVIEIVGANVFRRGRAARGVPSIPPYVSWFVVNGPPENTLSETPSIDRMQVQVDCWHQDDLECERLAFRVRRALERRCHCTGVPVDGRDEETDLYRLALQFDYWLRRSA